MCGIVGIAGKLEYKDEKLLKALLLNDYVRGPDSTGFASVTKENEFKIAKVSSHPFDLFDMLQFRSALSASQSTVFLGHNRAATRGKVNKANAHPFEAGDIVGCHNGTLEFNEWRDLEDALGEKFGTDSEAIITAIDKLGVKEAISLIRGAWSLVWYNKKEGTLNFLRNDQRPMYLAYSKEYDKMFWSSAWEILSCSFMLAEGYSAYSDLYHQKKDSSSYFPTEIDTHYRFDLETLLKPGGKLPKPNTRKIVGKAAEVKKAYENPFKVVGQDTDPNSPILGLPGPVTANTKGVTTSMGSDTVHERVANLFTAQPFAAWISKEKFEELTRHGCSWCSGNDFEWEDAGWIVIENGDYVICPDCTKERHANRVYTEKEPYLV